MVDKITNYDILSKNEKVLQDYNKKDLSPRTSDYTVWLDAATTLHDKINDKDSGFVQLEKGLVPAKNLPSYLDDVIEGYLNQADGLFYTKYDPATKTYSEPITGKDPASAGKGEAGIIYVDKTPSADADYLLSQGRQLDPTKDNQDDVYRCTAEGTFVRISDTTAETLRQIADLRGAVGVVSMSISPSTIYFTGTDINATVTATTNITADSLQIQSKALGSTTAKHNTTSISEAYSLAAADNVSPQKVTFTCNAGIGTKESRDKSVTLYTVNPIYYGVATTQTVSVSSLTKLSTPKLNPNGTYNIEIPEGDIPYYVFFAVPKGTNGMYIDKITLSGFDFPKELTNDLTDTNYRFYRSLNTYKYNTEDTSMNTLSLVVTGKAE